jgi:transposase InsO family protein
MADHAARTHQAEAVLAALAGRLLPAGAERHTQWGQEIGSVRVVLCCSDGDPDLMPTEGSCHDRVRTVFTTPWEEITDAA